MRFSGNVGSFRISADLINENPKAVRAILGSVIVLKAEYNFTSDYVEYVATGDQFKKVSEGDQPCDYIATLNENLTVSFEVA